VRRRGLVERVGTSSGESGKFLLDKAADVEVRVLAGIGFRDLNAFLPEAPDKGVCSRSLDKLTWVAQGGAEDGLPVACLALRDSREGGGPDGWLRIEKKAQKNLRLFLVVKRPKERRDALADVEVRVVRKSRG
jgi:hypothetical protein